MNNFLLAEKNIGEYCNNYIEHISGWDAPYLEEFFRIFLTNEINQSGGVAEIGLYHGKFFMMMNAIVEENFFSYAVDINQENVNDSIIKIKSNLTMYDAHLGKNTIFIDSNKYREILLEKIINKIKFFSINGYKSTHDTFEDLIIASAAIDDHGVIILNDIGNASYLCVMEGLIQFLEKNLDIKPFCNGLNKIFLCKSLQYDQYYELVNRSKLKFRDQIFMQTKIVEIVNIINKNA